MKREFIDNSKYEEYKLLWTVIKSLGKANVDNYLTKIFLHASIYLFVTTGVGSLSMFVSNELFSLLADFCIALYGLFFALISFTYLIKPAYKKITLFKTILIVVGLVSVLCIVGAIDIESISEIISPVTEILIVTFSLNGISIISNKWINEDDLSEEGKLKLARIRIYIPCLVISIFSGFRLADKVPSRVLAIISADNEAFSLGFMRVAMSMVLFFLFNLCLFYLRVHTPGKIKDWIQINFIKEKK